MNRPSFLLTNNLFRSLAADTSVPYTHGKEHEMVLVARNHRTKKYETSEISRPSGQISIEVSGTERSSPLVVPLALDLFVGRFSWKFNNRWSKVLQFRCSLQDALIFTAIIGGIQMLPQIGHLLWGKKKPDEFFVDHGYNLAGILIKVLCLMYIPY